VLSWSTCRHVACRHSSATLPTLILLIDSPPTALLHYYRPDGGSGKAGGEREGGRKGERNRGTWGARVHSPNQQSASREGASIDGSNDRIGQSVSVSQSHFPYRSVSVRAGMACADRYRGRHSLSAWRRYQSLMSADCGNRRVAKVIYRYAHASVARACGRAEARAAGNALARGTSGCASISVWPCFIHASRPVPCTMSHPDSGALELRYNGASSRIWRISESRSLIICFAVSNTRTVFWSTARCIVCKRSSC